MPVTNLYNKTAAFIRKDFLIESGYKMAFAIRLLNAVFPILSFFFVGKMISGNVNLERYGGSYFPFALVGIAFTSYFTLAVGTFSSTIRRSQMAGCLEAILSSQTSTSSVVLMSSVYSFISAGVQLILIFTIGTVFLHFDLSRVNIPATFVVFLLSLVTFVSMGILSAAGTILFKQGEPFGWIFGGLSSLIGGAFFPVSVMPHWLQYVAMVTPITHALEALRLAMLRHYSIAMLWPQIITLGMIGLFLFPASLAFFNWAVRKGKKDGTLMQY